METKKFIEYIEDCGYEARSYSGRGMYGRKCVGVTFDGSAVSLVVEIIRNAANGNGSDAEILRDIDELCDMLSAPSEDSMGLSSIIYWPNVRWTDDLDDTEDESDDDSEDCD